MSHSIGKFQLFPTVEFEELEHYHTIFLVVPVTISKIKMESKRLFYALEYPIGNHASGKY